MSQSVYFGKIGDGKTYHVMINELLPALAAGRRVYTNIDGLNEKEIARYLGVCATKLEIYHEVDAEWYRKNLVWDSDGDKEGEALGKRVKHGSMIVVDEAQNIWPARETKNTQAGFIKLLAYQRHFGLDFVFITQQVKLMDVVISRFCNDAYQIKNLGMLSKSLGRRYIVNRRQSPLDPDVIGQYKGKYDDKIFRLYKSASLRVKSTAKNASFLSRPMFKFAAVGLLLGIFFVANNGLFPGISKVKKDKGVAHGMVGNGVVAWNSRVSTPKNGRVSGYQVSSPQAAGKVPLGSVDRPASVASEVSSPPAIVHPAPSERLETGRIELYDGEGKLISLRKVYERSAPQPVGNPSGSPAAVPVGGVDPSRSNGVEVRVVGGSAR
jgi:hypothetical protein